MRSEGLAQAMQHGVRVHIIIRFKGSKVHISNRPTIIRFFARASSDILKRYYIDTRDAYVCA